MIEVHCSCLAATHTGSEALGRSKDICLTQCAPVHTTLCPVHPMRTQRPVRPECQRAHVLHLHLHFPCTPSNPLQSACMRSSTFPPLARISPTWPARLVSQHDLGYPSHYPGSSSLSLSKPIKCPCHLSHPPALAAETEKAKSMF